MKTPVVLAIAVLAAIGLVSNRSSANDGVVAEVCGPVAGTRFNLEPRVDANSQFDPSVDFLRNEVATDVDLVVGAASDTFSTKYDINRDGDCAPEFEGTLPKFSSPSPFEGFEPLHALGSPLVRTDAGRNVAFIASPYSNFDVGAVGILRTTSTTLLDPAACPAGRHTAAQTATCWPKRVLVAASFGFFSDPSIAVDQRTAGIGAGNVYIALRQMSDAFVPQTVLVACKNDLSVCAAPVLLSTDEAARYLEVSVRPDGRPSVIYVIQNRQSDPPFKQWDDIRHLSCTPAMPPSAPTCTPARLVHSEKQPLRGAVAQIFSVGTRPKHDHRVDANGTETYVTWERCKVPGSFIVPGNFSRGCPDSDLVMKASVDDGATWSTVACVDCGPQHQFVAAIRADHRRGILNIAYYSSEVDVVYQKRLQVKLAQVDPGAVTPDPITNTHVITTLATDPQADKVPQWFTGTIGLSARSGGTDGSGRAYIHFIFNNVQGTYNGIKVPDANNHLGRLDY